MNAQCCLRWPADLVDRHCLDHSNRRCASIVLPLMFILRDEPGGGARARRGRPPRPPSNVLTLLLEARLLRDTRSEPGGGGVFLADGGHRGLAGGPGGPG